MEGGFTVNEDVILPESDIDKSLNKKNIMAYKVVLDDKMVGGAIVVINQDSKTGYLDFLYVKHGMQGKSIGKFMWSEIERLNPEIKVWETCTPYFERRNVHFYINVCGFHAVEFFNPYHPDPNVPEDYFDKEDFGMFIFRKTSGNIIDNSPLTLPSSSVALSIFLLPQKLPDIVPSAMTAMTETQHTSLMIQPPVG